MIYILLIISAIDAYMAKYECTLQNTIQVDNKCLTLIYACAIEQGSPYPLLK